MEMRGVGEKERVCVTGAGGFVASWLVKFLLQKGYIVHGTVRDPCDEKNAHLKEFENAPENLQLFKADLLDYEGLYAGIAGCSGVFHVACPVPAGTFANPEVDMIEPAVIGTRNVLNACSKAKAKRVVVVSSIAAVMNNPNWPKDHTMDEECWSDRDFCKTTKKYYSLAKTIAESEAFEYAKRGELDIVTVCPSNVIGTMLQPTINSSSLLLLTMLKGFFLPQPTIRTGISADLNSCEDGHESLENKNRHLVDVRDVAEAIMLIFEKPEAKGRYICTSYAMKVQVFANKLKGMYPYYNHTKSFTEVDDSGKLSSEKLQDLGWKYRPLEESIVDSVTSYQERGFLLKE